MKILGHIHTLNDEEVIEQSLAALLDQTYPVEEIVVVDNGSTDGTIGKLSSKPVTLFHHGQNLGTSGSVATGFQYALTRGYEWVWVLDADSVPHKDALEKLVKLYYSFPPDHQSQIGVLTSRMDTALTHRVIDYFCLTPKGPRAATITPDLAYCECDCTIWSGSLFSLDSVRKVGLPRFGRAGFWEDLSLDWGDIEFCYRIRQGGYRVLVHRYSLFDHPIGRPEQRRVLGRMTSSSNHPPFRRYLYFRNMVFFLYYIYSDTHPLSMTFHICTHFLKVSAKILMMEEGRIQKIWASLRGIWDGLFKQLHRRYSVNG